MLSKAIIFLGLVAISLALPEGGFTDPAGTARPNGMEPREFTDPAGTARPNGMEPRGFTDPAGTAGPGGIEPRAGTCVDMPSYMSGNRIVGGAAAPSAIPYQVSFRQCTSGGCHFCGGTIVDAKTVVSAAHCTTVNSDLSSRYIMAGATDRFSSAGQVIQVDKGIWNSEMPYNSGTMDNDIVILKLKTALTFNDNVQPACLPASTFAPDASGQKCYVSGWGTLSSGAGSLPQALQYVDVPMITNAKCNEGYGGAIKDNMICAGYEQGGKDSCQGDSGGPLVCNVDGKATLTGVVSWGHGCALAGKAGVYARVTTFLSWINANMEGGTPSPPSAPPAPNPPSPTAAPPAPTPAPPAPTDCPDKVEGWWGDNYCDDFMNNEGCAFDGGDCCQDSPIDNWDTYCKDCECLEPCENDKPHWFDDGWCDDYLNNAPCKFDGGDCCPGTSAPSSWDAYCDDCVCKQPIG